jgi:predicted metal-binding membrane protein
MAAGAPMPGGWTLSMLWMGMPGAAFLGMWIVMMVAMMLPPLVPMLAILRRGGLATLAGAGYFSVWALFGAAIYALGTAVAGVEMQRPAVARFAPLATGVVVLAAGGLQMTAWKRRRLARCRACEAPASPDAWSALRHGLGYGVQCAVCCSGLMAILLVAGMMRLGVVVAVAAAISLERLAPRPDIIARAVGAVAIVIGLLAIGRAVGMVL